MLNFYLNCEGKGWHKIATKATRDLEASDVHRLLLLIACTTSQTSRIWQVNLKINRTWSWRLPFGDQLAWRVRPCGTCGRMLTVVIDTESALVRLLLKHDCKQLQGLVCCHDDETMQHRTQTVQQTHTNTRTEAGDRPQLIHSAAKVLWLKSAFFPHFSVPYFDFHIRYEIGT